MSELALPPLQAYHPTTFQERGVLIPFTTPLLSGVRARPGVKSGLELVVPNPSGGPGVYIMGWGAIPALCRPTLHDRELSSRIGAIANILPSTIRRIAREVAAEGLAGEEAMQAALAAADTDKHDRTVTNFLLLLGLIDQIGLFAAGPPGTPDMEIRARMTVAKVAPLVGRSADWVATALESLGDVLAPIGLEGQPQPSRVPRLMAQLRDTCAALSAWSRGQRESDQAAYVEMIATAAGHSMNLAEDLVARTRALTTDLTALLTRWAADSFGVVRQATQAEWLLDGWEQICLIWRCAEGDVAKRSALMEIAQLVPVMPEEAKSWSNLAVDTEIASRLRRSIPLNEDWRTGAVVFELIARNERMKAAAC